MRPLLLLLALTTFSPAGATPTQELVSAARAQIGVTLRYDPSYQRLAYPNGDVPLERGVCTDVVIRAYRQLGIDLQKLVHEDMRAHWIAYPHPTKWKLKRPDTNIDHRGCLTWRLSSGVMAQRSHPVAIPIAFFQVTSWYGNFLTVCRISAS